MDFQRYLYVGLEIALLYILDPLLNPIQQLEPPDPNKIKKFQLFAGIHPPTLITVQNPQEQPYNNKEAPQHPKPASRPNTNLQTQHAKIR